MKKHSILNEYDKMCCFCESSTPLADGNYLCKTKGVVTADYKCGKFYFDITRLKVNIDHIRLENIEDE